MRDNQDPGKPFLQGAGDGIIAEIFGSINLVTVFLLFVTQISSVRMRSKYLSGFILNSMMVTCMESTIFYIFLINLKEKYKENRTNLAIAILVYNKMF